MKKLLSLIKATMTSDMSLFKLKSKKNKSNLSLIIIISFCLMFSIWSYANALFEKMENLQVLVLALFAFLVSILTFIEGIYKAGPLMFNSKDDQLLLSLPIKRRTVLFIRIFKFYVFEVLFNALFFVPLVIAYIRWANHLDWTYFLTSFIMLFTLPIIPIVLSCVIGLISSSIASRFKYKNIVQIIISMAFLLGIMYVYSNISSIINYIMANATSINDLIMKIYYPAGMYAKLAVDFNIIDLLVFILINISIFIIAIFILGKFYFKINSRLKKATTSKKVNINSLKITSRSIYKSLIKKELNTFLQTPVLVINAGLGLLLFILASIFLAIKFDSFIPILTNPNGVNISFELIKNNLSIIVLILITAAGFMTSITNSLVSLEGKNISILKSLPIKTKTILMSKIYACLFITTPIILLGDIILIIKFKINIIESILLIILSVLIPLVSHFIGLLINLKYPKLDAENATEVVKQSVSSFVSVMIGMLLLIVYIAIIFKMIGNINSLLILIISTVIYLIINLILYLLLVIRGVKKFNKLSI